MQGREDEAGAEDDGGVHVVPAGVGAVGHLGAVGAVGLAVRDGQGVDVGPQGEHARPAGPLSRLGAGADVADEPGADGQHTRCQTGPLQPFLDRGGGAELLVAQLGVHVEVATEGHELRAQRVRQGAGQHGFTGSVGLGLWGHQHVHPLKGRTPQ